MATRGKAWLRMAVAVTAVVAPIAVLTVPGTIASAAGPLYSPLGRYPSGDTPATFQGPVPRAACGPGSKPEVDIQGRVPVSERKSGASSKGYRCNLEAVGHYGPDDPQGFEGADWQLARYKHCAYYSQRLVGAAYPRAAGALQPDDKAAYASRLVPQERPGTVVVDVSDPTDPRYATNIFTLGMGVPRETLKVHAGRGLLAAANTLDSQGGSFMGIYDISKDCTKPEKLFDGPISAVNHEGNFSADGMTYYASGVLGGAISAIDVSDPRNPKLLTTFLAKTTIHGMSTSRDGNLLFLSHINEDFLKFLVPEAAVTGSVPSLVGGNGMGIYDISEIQQRRPNPQVRLVNALEWRDGQVGQHTLNFAKDGRNFAIEVSESGHGAARIIDITDLENLEVVAKLKTEIMMPENADEAAADIFRPPYEVGGTFIPFGYNFHYCNLDRLDNPAMLACSAFNQGVRVFDIRDLAKPKEIAYFNPGGDGTLQPGSWGGTYSGYPTAMPQFVPERKELWITDQDRGLFVLRFTNGSWISKVKSSDDISHGN